MTQERIYYMKKYLFFVFPLLVCLLVSCSGNNLTTPPQNTGDQLPTLTAAIPTSFPSETTIVQTTPTQSPTATQLSLDDFQDKQLAGENDSYAIYLTNRTGGTDDAPTGELLVFNKSSNQVTKMSGSFTVIIGGGTVVFDDGVGKYILLSIGTYTSRNAVVLSLVDQKQAANDFCISSGQYGDHLFWNDYVVFNTCDTFTNRPWGAGEAPGVTAINLKTGTLTVIAKSDLTHQYAVKQVDGNTLQYVETYVEDSADWQDQNKQKTDDKTFALISLGSN